MKDVLDKLTTYNIFNYLFPGILFVVISKYLTTYNLIQEDNIIGGFLYYFIGMIISRIGSLIIEPLLKYFNFLKFSDYKDFVIASKKDVKIELLSEVNNTYRTLISLIITLILLKVYNILSLKYSLGNEISIVVSIILILILFLFSYQKQTKYITKRININN